MKTTSYILIVMILFLASCKPSAKEAANYNNDVVRIQQDAVSETMQFSSKVSIADSVEAYKLMGEFDKTLAGQKKKLEELKFNGDDRGMKAALLEAFTYFDGLIDNEYKQILDIRFAKPARTNAQSEISTIVNSISKKGQGIDDKFKDAQQKFAKDYNIMLLTR